MAKLEESATTLKAPLLREEETSNEAAEGGLKGGFPYLDLAWPLMSH